MDLSLGEISEALNADLVGPAEARAATVCTPEEPTADGVCLIFNEASVTKLGTSSVAACLVTKETEIPGFNLLRVENPRAAMITLLNLLHPREAPTPGISPEATVSKHACCSATAFVAAGVRIADGAVIGEGVEIHANTVIGENVEIGDESLLYPNVTVAPGCRIGHRVIVHSGAVIGSDGFGYNRDCDGRYHKIPQVGIVIVEDDVEVGAGTTIDRATVGITRIGRGTKIDNQVQIAHNCSIGADCCLVAQAGVAGSVVIGERTQLGGQCGISDHITIAADSRVAAQAGVVEDLGQGDWMGTPAIAAATARRAAALNARFPEVYDELRSLRRRLAALDADPAGPSGSR